MSLHRSLGRPLRRASATVDRAMTVRETSEALARRPIVVFSMGKTGTTSLTAAIETAARRPVLKAHALSRTGIDSRLAKSARLSIVRRPHFLWACEEISRTLQADGQWDLLCGVREPVALAVSDHFYGLQRQRESGQQPWISSDEPDAHLEAIERNLQENFVDTDWFDSEMRSVTGIDVYAAPFDHEAGHAIYASERFRALLVRAEDLTRVGAQSVADFLGLDAPVSIERRNPGTSAEPDSAYRRFVERGTLAPDLVERVYATPMARHFYTEGERAEFHARWTGALV